MTDPTVGPVWAYGIGVILLLVAVVVILALVIVLLVEEKHLKIIMFTADFF